MVITKFKIVTFKDISLIYRQMSRDAAVVTFNANDRRSRYGQGIRRVGLRCSHPGTVADCV